MKIYEDPIKYIKIYIIACILPHNDPKSKVGQIMKCTENLTYNYLYIKWLYVFRE